MKEKLSETRQEGRGDNGSHTEGADENYSQTDMNIHKEIKRKGSHPLQTEGLKFYYWWLLS